MPSIKPPAEPVANIQYRKELRKWALLSSRNRQWLLDRCGDDFFFWLESFAFLFEPRPAKDKAKILPFLPWPKQYEVMQTIIDNLGYRDIGIEKARGMGASWLCICIFLWRWLFGDMEAFGIVSRNEMAADNPDDPGSLGSKIDWQLRMLPNWMTGLPRTVGNRQGQYTRNISRHTWFRHDNNCSITAYPATGELASGGRATAFLMDELAKFARGEDEQAMAATEPVSNCRLLVSTYWGADGAYYNSMREESSMIKLVLGWEDAPPRAEGMFCVDRKKFRLVHPETRTPILPEYTKHFFGEIYPILAKRGFNVESESKLWSPWYVERCIRPRMTPRAIAEEYDRDPAGSGSRFFSPAVIERLSAKATQPEVIGTLQFEHGTCKPRRWMKDAAGIVRLWTPVYGGARGMPPTGNYVLGVDIATGSGGDYSSNSVISIVNRDTGQKVGEIASPVIKPKELAELALALCYWFAGVGGRPAYLIFEANGPGLDFRDRILDSSFRNFYWRTPWRSTKKKPTKEPGWWSDPNSKNLLLGNYRWALSEGYFANPSKPALTECMSYAYGTGNKLVFLGAPTDAEDPSNAGANHADRVIADALANYAIEHLGGGHELRAQSKKRASTMAPPAGSFLERRIESQLGKERKKEW